MRNFGDMAADLPAVRALPIAHLSLCTGTVRGFSDKMLRQLCTDRNLPRPEGVTTWDRVGSQKCAKELLDWRNKHNK
jgi:hypothetical protein